MMALAFAFSAVASVASADTMVAVSFNSNLTVGNRGADVVSLQSFLVSKGFLTMPAGVAMGYFGGLTKSAVAAYQVSKGITPSAGYFGPITRAAVSADSAVTTTTTGTTTTTAGCPVGAMFNSMTGAACTTNTTTTTTTTTTATPSTVEGSLNTQLASNPADNANIRTQTDVPVFGLTLRAQIADVSVQTLDLQVNVTNAGQSENPATLINTMKVWDGSNVIATIPVNTTTFTKDQNQVYYYRLSGLNFLVPKGQTKTIVVSFSTNSIDATRVVTIQGYGSSALRAVSGAGVSSFYNVGGSGYTRTQTFLKPGTSILTLSAATTPLRSMNNRVNPNGDSLQGVTLSTFNLKSDTGDSTLLTVYASTTASGTLPTTLYLYQGSTLLKSMTVPSNGNVVFNNDTTTGSTVAANTIQTFTIKADFPSNTANGTFASTTIQSVVFETPNGNTATAQGSAVSSANQYVYTKAAIITLAGTPTITATNASITGGTSSVIATFPLSINAQGGTVNMPTSADVVVTFSNGQTATVLNTSVVSNPNSNIADGSTAAVTVTAKSVGFAPGLYNAGITSISWNAGQGTTTQTYGLEDFKTSAAANQQ